MSAPICAFGHQRVKRKTTFFQYWRFLDQKQLEMSKNVQNWIYLLFCFNPLKAECVWKNLIFDIFFATLSIIGHNSVILTCRNLSLTAGTQKQMRFQEIWLYWWFVKCFGLISAIKVKKFVKILMNNPYLTNFEGLPAPSGRQLGLVKLLIFRPYIYSFYPWISDFLGHFRPDFGPKKTKFFKAGPAAVAAGPAETLIIKESFSDKCARETGHFLKS